MQFLDPKIDMAFKKLFGSRNHTRVTISFLNAILEYTGDRQIESITFNNPAHIPEQRSKKEHILDVFCTDKAGRKFIIEMQNSSMKAFTKRILYYASMAYSNQLNAAKPYTDLHPVAIVAIANEFIAVPRAKGYKSIQKFMDVKDLECYNEDITLVYVDLLKFNKQEHELETDEDKWLFLLKEITSYDYIPAPLDEDEFREACELLDRIEWTDLERAFYVQDLLDSQAAQENAKLVAEAKQRIENAREEATLAERQAIARKMLAKGVDRETIAQLTDLTEDEIRAL